MLREKEYPKTAFESCGVDFAPVYDVVFNATKTYARLCQK